MIQDRIEKAMACIRILEDLYGEPHARKIDPLDLLVMTILSQNTTDKNSLRAFSSLKLSYPQYEDLLLAPQKEVAGIIRSGGLGEIKSKRIKQVLQEIKTHAGNIDLSFLKEMNNFEAINYLTSIPGIGPKTASVVLLFAFNLPFMPVDTHVKRVSERLGLVPKKIDAKKAQLILEKIVPPNKYLSLHLNLIRHGRVVCRARGPNHNECALCLQCDCFLESQKP